MSGAERPGGDVRRIPIFPLAGAILFPRTQLPLHIFEPRYRAMVRDAVSGGNEIGMIQPNGKGEGAPLYEVGCLGSIVGLEELDDGGFNIVLEGTRRFRVVGEEPVETLYRQVEADLSAFDDSADPPLAPVMRAGVEQEARRFGDALGLSVDWEAVARLDDELLVNVIAQVAPFDNGAKQALLEEGGLLGRAELVTQLMQFQRLALGGIGDTLRPTLN